MSNCCTPVGDKVVNSCDSPNLENPAKTNQCPACGSKGKKVDSITLKAMLNISLLAIRDVPYLFCSTANCETVYFADDGQQFFTRGQVREPVFQKEPQNEEVFVCYCFRHSPATIQAELQNTAQSTVVVEVTAGIKAGQCACEVRNPQGSCCLGNVNKVVKQIEQTVKLLA